MDVGLNATPLYKLACPITAEDHRWLAYNKLAELGPRGVNYHTKTAAADGTAAPEAQNEALVTHAEKLTVKKKRVSTGLSPQLPAGAVTLRPAQSVANELAGNRRPAGKSLARERPS